MAKQERDIKLLDRDTQLACEIFLGVCAERNLNVLITETFRTLERQKELYAQGRTTAGKIVTNCDGVKNKSIHQSRRAFDFCKNVKGQEYSDKALFKECGAIAKEIGLEWGGSWSNFTDNPHCQLNVGVKPKDIRSPKPTIHREYTKSYMDAVTNLTIKGYINSPEVWINEHNINLKNVEPLLRALGGIDYLVTKKVINSRSIWDSKQYKANHVMSLVENSARILSGIVK